MYPSREMSSRAQRGYWLMRPGCLRGVRASRHRGDCGRYDIASDQNNLFAYQRNRGQRALGRAMGPVRMQVRRTVDCIRQRSGAGSWRGRGAGCCARSARVESEAEVAQSNSGPTAIANASRVCVAKAKRIARRKRAKEIKRLISIMKSAKIRGLDPYLGGSLADKQDKNWPRQETQPQKGHGGRRFEPSADL